MDPVSNVSGVHSAIDASPDVSWQARSFDHPDAVQLLRAYAEERRQMVGFDDPPDLDKPSEYEPPAGAFLVGYDHDVNPIACGGVRTYPEGDHAVEIRKMYVAPAWRQLGLARRCLARLEELAVTQDAQVVLLETGSYNMAATRLYKSAGYRPIPPYVPGRPRFNRAFAKQLARSS